MQFKLDFTPKPFKKQLKHSDKVFLIGSCFTEQMGNKLAAAKFRTLQNPYGILFNPVSIAGAISHIINKKHYTSDDLFFHQELWGSWDHHTQFSATTATHALEKINTSQERATDFLRQADWIVITLGSAFVYYLEGARAVANCHKIPTDKFTKRMLGATEVLQVLQTLVADLKKLNPQCRVIFTISPVRHIRDGFVENNRSKAALILAVAQLTESVDDCFYFPAYELIIDDLRDYRFYAEDMVHPNYQATQYVWEKFQQACIEAESLKLMNHLNEISAAYSHKPFNPDSEAHQKFLAKNKSKLEDLLAKHRYLQMADELAYFSGR